MKNLLNKSKYIVSLLILVMALGIVGCGDKAADAEAVNTNIQAKENK
ncbi:MAG: hypothetical protein GX752_03765, partial [Clostridium sp.]|nr:hypothetical protein [Clostridium sp.]